MKKNFINITLSLLLAICYSTGCFAQANFELLDQNLPDPLSGGLFFGQVPNNPFDPSNNNTKWFSFFGTPSIVDAFGVKSVDLIGTAVGIPGTPSFGFASIEGEGLSHLVNFKKGRGYRFSMNIVVSSIVADISQLKVILFSESVPGATGFTLPAVSVSQIIFLKNFDINTPSGQSPVSVDFTANNDYKFIAIYFNDGNASVPTFNFIRLESFSLLEFVDNICCPSNRTYSNTSNLPRFTVVRDEIETTNNVNVLGNQKVDFKAGEEITFRAGFQSLLGSEFNAFISTCNNVDDFDLDVTIDLNPPPPFSGPMKELEAVVKGSVSPFPLQYSWTDAAMANLGSNSTILIDPDEANIYTVDVRDLCLYSGQGSRTIIPPPMKLSQDKGVSKGVTFEKDIIDFSIYPNPTNDIFNVEFTSGSTSIVTVRDMDGKVLVSKVTGSGFTYLHLLTSSLPNGVYTVTVENDFDFVVKKVMVLK